MHILALLKWQNHELSSVSILYQVDFIAYFQNFMLSYILYMLHVEKVFLEQYKELFKVLLGPCYSFFQLKHQVP